MWMNDILTQETPYRMLTLEELEEKYNLRIPFTEYYGMKSAIPPSWKNILQSIESDDAEDYKLIDMIDDRKNLLLKEKIEPPYRNTPKWSEELDLTINMDKFLRG